MGEGEGGGPRISWTMNAFQTIMGNYLARCIAMFFTEMNLLMQSSSSSP